MDLAWFVPIGLIGAIVLWVGVIHLKEAITGSSENNEPVKGGSKRNKSSKAIKHIALRSKRRRS